MSLVSAYDYDLMRGAAPRPNAAPAPAPSMMPVSFPSNVVPGGSTAPRGNMMFNAGSPGPMSFDAPAPTSTYFNRLRNVLDNPGSIGSDPAYRFLFDQGVEALNRSAGARRMRFAGKTMHDIQDFGQRAASQYMGQIAQLLSSGAREEREDYRLRLEDAQRRAEMQQAEASREAASSDPFGNLRRIAGQYGTAEDYARSRTAAADGMPIYGAQPAAFYIDQWRKGRRLLDAMR